MCTVNIDIGATFLTSTGKEISCFVGFPPNLGKAQGISTSQTFKLKLYI